MRARITRVSVHAHACVRTRVCVYARAHACERTCMGGTYSYYIYFGIRALLQNERLVPSQP